MASERERKLEEILAQFLKPVKGIPFEVVIRSLCSANVEKFDATCDPNIRLLGQLKDALRAACQKVQENPIERPRPNEVGNDMEPFVIDALRNAGLDAAPPRTRNGKGKSTGYPDARIETDNLPVFLEVKTYAAANHATTQRSFYLSPADDPKVFEDGYHLLVGFEIVRSGNLFKPVAFEIVDLYGLECDMKSEFNSDNKRLYEDARLLAKERV
jgi:hypothetical protein